MAFSLTTEFVNGVAKIYMEGELDASVATQLRDAVAELATQTPKCLVLMVDKLEYMASAGLRAFVFAKQKMGTNIDIYLVGAHGIVAESVEMTGFHHSVIMLPSTMRAD